MDLTLGVLEEWRVAYDCGEEVPEYVMRELFSLAKEKLSQIEDGQ